MSEPSATKEADTKARWARIARIEFALCFLPPLGLWMLQETLGSEEGYARWHAFFSHPVAKLALVGGAWLYAHHFFAGIRFLILDTHVGMGKASARASALAVFAAGIAAALVVAWRVW